MAVRLLEPRMDYGETFTQVPNTVALDESLSGLAKATYLALASFAWQEGECWPSQMALAKRAGMSRRQVIRCLDELRRAGYVEQNESEQRATLTYRLLPVREHQPRTLQPVSVPYSTDESETEGCATQAQGYDSQAQGVCHTGTGGYDSQAHKEYSVEEYSLTNARTREIDEPIHRVLAAFGMTEAPWSANAISEKLASYEETYPALDAVAEAEGLRSESDAEGRKTGNWLARWDGWMAQASRRQGRLTATTMQAPASTAIVHNRTVPLDFASVPQELMPDAHPDVPHYMQLMDRALRWYVSEKGKTQWPHQYGVFRCAPAADQCDESRLVLLTDEPPDAAEQMTKFLRILARGFEARVESRWAS